MFRQDSHLISADNLEGPIRLARSNLIENIMKFENNLKIAYASGCYYGEILYWSSRLLTLLIALCISLWFKAYLEENAKYPDRQLSYQGFSDFMDNKNPESSQAFDEPLQKGSVL